MTKDWIVLDCMLKTWIVWWDEFKGDLHSNAETEKRSGYAFARGNNMMPIKLSAQSSKGSAKDCSAYSHGTICTRMTRTNQDENCRCHCILLLMKTMSKWFHRDPFWHKKRTALAAVCSHVQNWTRQSQIVDVKFNETLSGYIHTLIFDSKDVVGKNTKNCVFIVFFHPSIFVRHLYS